MTIEWRTTPNGIDAYVGPLHLIIGKSKHGHHSWEVNAPDVDDDVQGRAYSEARAKRAAEAVAVAMLEVAP